MTESLLVKVSYLFFRSHVAVLFEHGQFFTIRFHQEQLTW